MSYFPAFINIDTKRILIVGGGKIAFEKLTKILDFSTDVTLVATRFNEEILQTIRRYGLTYSVAPYTKGLIRDFDIVIVAVDDIELQKSIYKESRSYNCLYNAVDLPQYCDFIFPSYVKRGDLTIAVSTSGASPAFAKRLRMFIERILPKDIDSFLNEMKKLRSTMPKGKDRMRYLEQKAKEYIEGWKL